MNEEQGFQVGKTYRVKPECYNDFRFVGWWKGHNILQSSTFEVQKIENGSVIDTNDSGSYIATASEFKYCELVTTEKETGMKKANEFKVGDKVYLPSSDTKVHVVGDYQGVHYPLLVSGDSFTSDGKCNTGDKHPRLFRTTKENHALLEALYGVEFEKPVLEGDELTIELLKKGKPVLCYVYDDHNNFESSALIKSVTSDGRFKANGIWNHATPVPLSEIGNV